MKPCKECPFKKGSVAGWLGPYKTPLQFVQDSFQQDGMTCHMSVERDDLKVCVGSLHCANKSAKQFQGELLSAQKSVADDTDAADQCMTAPEFIEHHQLG
jgi:hypothetical protein